MISKDYEEADQFSSFFKALEYKKEEKGNNKMLNFVEFKRFYYKKKYLPEGIYSGINLNLNENQLKTKYNKYVKIIENKKMKMKQYQDNQVKKNIEKLENNELIDHKWEELKKRVYIRDNGQCQLWKKLNDNEKVFLRRKFNPETEIIDYAHVFGRGAHPNLKYESENVVMLYRYFHSCLDHYIDPFKGKTTKKDNIEKYWIKIVGQCLYEKLKRKL